jgi:hypothetical protein
MSHATKPSRKETARDLAWIAERADGLRDVNLVLIRTPDGKLDLVPAEETNAEPILEVRTPSKKKQEPRQDKLPLTIEKDWDAVFLSESAVGKFLIPYYVAQRLLTQEELDRLRVDYQSNPKVIGIIHIPPSRPKLLYDNGEAKDFVVGRGSGVQMKLDGEIETSW